MGWIKVAKAQGRAGQRIPSGYVSISGATIYIPYEWAQAHNILNAKSFTLYLSDNKLAIGIQFHRDNKGDRKVGRKNVRARGGMCLRIAKLWRELKIQPGYYQASLLNDGFVSIDLRVFLPKNSRDLPQLDQEPQPRRKSRQKPQPEQEASASPSPAT